jgi:hypothetical protein
MEDEGNLVHANLLDIILVLALLLTRLPRSIVPDGARDRHVAPVTSVVPVVRPIVPPAEAVAATRTPAAKTATADATSTSPCGPSCTATATAAASTANFATSQTIPSHKAFCFPPQPHQSTHVSTDARQQPIEKRSKGHLSSKI